MEKNATRLRPRGNHKRKFDQVGWDEDDDPLYQMAGKSFDQQYEVTTGTYKEDLIDLNIIKFLNSRRALKAASGYIGYESSTEIDDINVLIEDVYSKINKDALGTCIVHTKNNAEFFTDNTIISIAFNPELKSLTFEGYGDITLLRTIEAQLKEAYPVKTDSVKMSWHYSTSRGNNSADLPLALEEVSVKDSYYPFIEGGVDAYLEKFHTSKSSILLLTGEPGTGKTSLIRYYISKYKLNTIVTYDENVMATDEFFINFLINSKKDTLIIEDADLLLADREGGQNKIMSKFLNVSDGLLKSSKKKIIFSTNITQLSKIDPAIIRPGRCHDTIQFRKLTSTEAAIVCDEVGLPPFDDTEPKSLADIFNRSNKTKVNRTGFF
jgi:GTPase SAR1 family protein